MNFVQKKLKGSVLGFSLILLALILLSGITLVSVSVLERKASFATQKSVLAFQSADSAAERVLKRVYVDNSPLIASVPLNSPMPSDSNLALLGQNLDAANEVSCSSGVISGKNIVSASANYEFRVTFYDTNGATIGCSRTDWRDALVTIQSEGFYQRTSRVIDIGIKPRQ